MTAPLTGAALARAYNALRERADHHNDGSCMSCYDWCSTCAEIRRDLAALPPLPVADVPEVGSRWVGPQGEVWTIQSIGWRGVAEFKGETQEFTDNEFKAGVASGDFRPAPEAGE